MALPGVSIVFAVGNMPACELVILTAVIAVCASKVQLELPGENIRLQKPGSNILIIVSRVDLGRAYAMYTFNYHRNYHA